MSINLEHQCDGRQCRKDADYCYCQTCLDEATNEAYEEGFKAGRKEGLEEASTTGV